MLKVALTGGIGSGKSAAGDFFEDLGAVVVDADQLARDAIERGTDGFDELVATFGDDILSNGILDRAKLGAIVFADADARIKLEGIIHPRVQDLFNEIVESSPLDAVIIYQIPILVETNSQDRFDYVITVETTLDNRISRLKKRGLKGYEIEARLQAQATDEERAKIADTVFNNDGDADQLLRQVENIYEDVLLPRAKASAN
ncbi:MAG: dephospho-CoA kinase [Candidatus Nanopelagicaceae bacterium]